jgi:hypothetical protein
VKVRVHHTNLLPKPERAVVVLGGRVRASGADFWLTSVQPKDFDVVSANTVDSRPQT